MFIVAMALPIVAVPGEESTIATYNVKTQSVQYTTDKKTVGFLAQPEGLSNSPALILIHEWWGLNQNIKDIAVKFAQEGYTALAVDLYRGQVTKSPGRAKRLARHVRGGHMDDAFSNLKTAITYLKAKETVDGNRIGSIGWCFGGGWSYQIAKNNLGAKTSIIYYGKFNPKDDLSKMKAVIQGHFASEDQHIRVDTVKAFQAKLKTLTGNHEIYIYPNTDHAFANEGLKRFKKKEAALAWDRTLTFLKSYL